MQDTRFFKRCRWLVHEVESRENSQIVPSVGMVFHPWASRHGKHVVVLLATMEMPSTTSHLFTLVIRDRCRLFLSAVRVCVACPFFLTCLPASQRQPHSQPLLREESRNLESKAAQNQATHSLKTSASSEKTRKTPADPQRHCPHFNTRASSCMHSGPISTPKVNKSGSLVLLLRLLPSRCSALQPATPPKLPTDPVALAPCSQFALQNLRRKLVRFPTFLLTTVIAASHDWSFQRLQHMVLTQQLDGDQRLVVVDLTDLPQHHHHLSP